MRFSEMILNKTKQKQKNALDILKEAYEIYKGHLGQMLIMILLSWIPFIGDSLHTAVVEQYKNKKIISLSSAFLKVINKLGNIVLVKILFQIIIFGQIILTGFLMIVPQMIFLGHIWLSLAILFIVAIIGIINIFYYTLYSSIASNVAILENKTGIKAMRRCRQLVRQNRDTEALCASYLLGIPFVSVAFWVFISYLFEKAGFLSSNILNISYIIITFILIVVTFSVLESGNTLLYYELIDREKCNYHERRESSE